jgi:hypothetical protein
MILEYNINYKFIGVFDVDPIIKKIQECNFNWDDYKFRQERYKDHSETRTIPMIWDEKFKNVNKWYPYYNVFLDDIDSIEEYIRKNICDRGKMMTFILINLPSGKSISRHRDINPYIKNFNRCHRIHIPITTNEECFFEIEGEIKNLKKGEVWEISNINKMHSVYNRGKSDRIHLLIDWDPI